jgi:hypothetical protein
MKLLSQSASYSPLVVTEHGIGFLCTRTRELRKAFSVHVSPAPVNVRPATPEEAKSFYELRQFHAQEAGAYYDRATATGGNTGD